jgi:hypothetical protein
MLAGEAPGAQPVEVILLFSVDACPFHLPRHCPSTLPLRLFLMRSLALTPPFPSRPLFISPSPSHAVSLSPPPCPFPLFCEIEDEMICIDICRRLSLAV